MPSVEHRQQHKEMSAGGLGRSLTITGSLLLIGLCGYESSVRWQDFDAWISGVRTMSRLKDESFLANLWYIFQDVKMQGMLLLMLFLLLGIFLGFMGLLPRKRPWRIALFMLWACLTAVPGFLSGALSFGDIRGMLRLIPFIFIIAGGFISAVSQKRRKVHSYSVNRVEEASRHAVGPSGRQMRVIVSACLLGENCKYSGGNNKCDKVIRFLEGKTVIPVCPEVMGGLGSPRLPCEIRNGKVVDAQGRSMEEPFRKGAMKCLALARQEGANLAVLKENSPSCGVRSVYDGTFSGKLKTGKGVFAEMLVREGIPVLSEKDFDDSGDTQNKKA